MSYQKAFNIFEKINKKSYNCSKILHRFVKLFLSIFPMKILKRQIRFRRFF